MRVSLKKVNAIIGLKFQMILKNQTIITVPIMSVGFVVLMDSLMPNESEDGFRSAFLLTFGLLFNVVMGGIMMSSYPIAEEKEKNTLRVLMTSSINSLEFFVGSTIPSLLILVLFNILLIPLSGNSFSQIPFLSYFAITTFTSLISLLLGFILGMLSKNQMQAGILGMPLMLLLTLSTTLRTFNDTLDTIVSYTYSGVLSNFIDEALSTGYLWNATDSLVFLGWFALAIGLFIYAYRSNGLDG